MTTNFNYSINSKDSLANSISQTLTSRVQNSVSQPLSTAGSSPLNQSLTSQGPIQSSGPSLNVDPVIINTGIYSTVTPRRSHNTSVTIINTCVSQVIKESIKLFYIANTLFVKYLLDNLCVYCIIL